METETQGESLLIGMINTAWSALLSGVSKADFSNEIFQSELLAPEPDNANQFMFPPHWTQQLRLVYS